MVIESLIQALGSAGSIGSVKYLLYFRITMNIEEIREYCICIPEVTEGFPFGDPALVFIVAGKMFALLDLSEESRGISLKCDPERAIELREKYEAIQPGWHMNKVI
jgi:predicted DNA-binding protein (MmcQ/YjbR family)